MQKEQSQFLSEDSNSYEGLGGWLILLGLKVVSPCLFFLENLWTLINEKAVRIIYTLGSATYMPLRVLEFITYIAILISNCYIAYLFFTKKSLFPKLFIRVSILSIFAIVFFEVLLNIFIPTELINPDASNEILVFSKILIVTLIIWAKYISVSKRVKATFVR